MRRPSKPAVPLEAKLGLLAMAFRGAKDEDMRKKTACEYGRIVDNLIDGRKWKEMPAFEDMLPDEWMPKKFFEHWSIPPPPGQSSK